MRTVAELLKQDVRGKQPGVRFVDGCWSEPKETCRWFAALYLRRVCYGAVAGGCDLAWHRPGMSFAPRGSGVLKGQPWLPA